MTIHNLFLIFGIGAAAFAVIISIVGLRSKNFPSRNAMIGLILFGVFMVVGTSYYGVKLQMEEAEEREEGDENIIGEEASISPVRIPANLV